MAFYRDVLGLPLLFEAGPGMAFFDCGGARLMLSVAEDERFDHPASVLYYRVADIEQSFAAIRERGGQAEAEPHLVAQMPDHELWMAFFRDSEGNVFALMEERRE